MTHWSMKPIILSDWLRWQEDTPAEPLMLYDYQARKFGVSEAGIEAARVATQPCPKEWGVPHKTWTIIKPIQTRLETWEGVKVFVSTPFKRKS